MISITENRKFRYLLYISVYLVEGLATLLIFTILPIYLKNYKGLSDLSIAILAGVSLLPVILRPLVAVVSDKYSIGSLGHRKAYMIFGFILNGITLSTISITDPAVYLFLFGLLWILQSLGISLMDVSMDALVIEGFPETNEKMNANIFFQVSVLCSLFIALPIAAICEQNVIRLSLYITSQLGFDIFIGGNFEFGFLLAGIICVGINLVILFFEEPEKIKAKPAFSREVVSEYVKSKYVPTLLLLFFLINIDSGLTDFTLDPFFRILGLTSGVQLLSFSPMVLIALLGTLASKWFIKKGLINSIIIASIIAGVFYVFLSLFTFINTQSIPLLYYSLGIIVYFFTAVAFIMYLVLGMNSADEKIAATSFVLLMTMSNLGRIVGIVIAGLLPFSIFLKMGIIFMIAAIIMFGRIPVFLRVKDLEKEIVQ